MRKKRKYTKIKGNRTMLGYNELYEIKKANYNRVFNDNEQNDENLNDEEL